MTDLSTQYMGLTLRNPLIASASPLTGTLDGVRRLAESGIGAIVLPSLFEEQLRQTADRTDELTNAKNHSYAESLSYFPALSYVDPGPRRYLSLLERAASAVDVPVIASLNGIAAEALAVHALAMQDAGAAAIELNINYIPGDPQMPARDVEQRQSDVFGHVKHVVTIPVAVKLSPYFSSVAELALALDAAGADALVLFNRFLIPDIDPDRLEVATSVELSRPGEARLPRTWIALLHGQLRASLAASSGVETAADIASYLLAGADTVMTTSALLRHGPEYASTLIDDLTTWIATKGFSGVEDVRGKLAVPADADPAQYERAAYVRAMRAANAGAYTRDRYGR